jgi:hypothetical protein
VDRTFTVQNTSTISLSGTASISAPYSIQAGGSFSLAAGASQTVTVRFRPTSSGTFAGNVNFVAGSDTISRAVTGSGTGSAPAAVTLSVTKNGSGSGTVAGTPAGINCGATCSQSVTAGTALTLTATPAAGSTFAGWGGACSGTGTCAVTVNAATTVTATFNLASGPSSALSTAPGAPGNPSVSLLSTDSIGATFAFAWAPGSGATSYAYTVAFNDGSSSQQGTVTTPSLQLRMPYRASGAGSGYICVKSVNTAGQSGLACNTVSVPAPAATPSPVTLSVAKSGSGSGTVSSTPGGINCGATCSQSVTTGTALTLTATSAAGSTFAGWSGACSGTGTCAVTVNAATTVTATFNLTSAPSSAPSSAQDTFNRPNETPLGGSWTSNGFTLVANHAQPQSFASDADAFWKAPTPWPANQWMQAKLTITGTGGQTQGIGFAARSQGNQTYYRFVVDHAVSNNVNFARFNNAAFTNLGSCTHTWTDGATWKLQVTTVGATVKLQAFRDGVQVCGDILDTAPQRLLSGQPGMAFSSNAVSASLDDWSAGGL